MTAQTRTYIYTVVVAAIPLLVVAGIIAADQATLWLTLAAAILGLGGTGLAVAHRPTLAASERDEHDALTRAATAAVGLYRAEAPEGEMREAMNALGAQVRQ